MSKERQSALMAIIVAGRRLTRQATIPELGEEFGGLLWRDLMISLLLGVAERPNARAIEARASDAAAAFLRLHPIP